MAKSVRRQHRGGLAGLRGGDFERFFATYRILFAVDEVSRGEPVRFATQLRTARRLVGTSSSSASKAWPDRRSVLTSKPRPRLVREAEWCT